MLGVVPQHEKKKKKKKAVKRGQTGGNET